MRMTTSGFMRRGRWWGVLALGLLVGRAEPLKVATYNVENYGPADRMTEAGYRKAYPKPEAEKRALRQVVRGLDADVLALQEMGSAAHLEELRRDLRGEGLDYPHAALAVAADEERSLALLSKLPLLAVTTHVDLTHVYFGMKEPVKRGLLEASVHTAGGDITVFVLHLKSRLTERPDDPLSGTRRAGEAMAIRDRILRRFPSPAEARFLVLGDCNDTRVSRAAGLLQKKGKTDIARLLSGADTRGETWSHVFRREETYTRVDHILVSPGLGPAVMEGGARVYDGTGVREASDHRPVYVILEPAAGRERER